MSGKVDFYTQIWANNVKTILLFVVFFLIIIGLGWIIGFFFDNIYVGLSITLIVATLYSFIAYFAGSQIVLKLTGAREVTKAEYPYYVNTVEGLAIAAGLPTPKAYVIDTPALNAFATGRNHNHAAVTVTTGLMEKLNREELEGVVAHEIAHIKNLDIRTMLIAGVLVGIVVFLADFIFRVAIFGGGQRRSGGDGRAMLILLVIGIILAILAPFVAYAIKLAISRKREYVADAEGARLTRNPPALARALQKISGDTHEFVQASSANEHMFISTPKTKSFFSKMFSTHPPIKERIELLKNM